MSTKTYPHKWIAATVAQKVGVVETAAAFLRRRAGPATGDGLSALLELVSGAEPAPGDRVPDNQAKLGTQTKNRTRGS